MTGSEAIFFCFFGSMMSRAPAQEKIPGEIAQRITE